MYKIILEQEDFLRFQLFTASQSKEARRKRRSTWLIVSGIMFSLGFVLLQETEKLMAYYFIAFGFVALFFFPLYQRIQIKKQHLKYINQHFKSRFGQKSEVGFNGGYVVSIADDQEGKLKITEIAEVAEIADNMFIKFKTGDSLIIPKRSSNFDQIRKVLKSKTSNLKIEWHEKPDWEWK